MNSQPRHLFRKAVASWLFFWVAFSPLGTASAATVLADVPIFATKKVPPNLMLDLSVEWPTGTVAAYNDNYVDPTIPGNAGYECSGREDNSGNSHGRCYFDNRTYLGYFDPLKCYDYVGTPGTEFKPPDDPSSTKGYFTPTAFGSGPNGHQCTGKWSGNFLNWGLMQAIDTFRWNLTGGDRVVDTPSKTIIEKARHTGQGRYTQFPIKKLDKSEFEDNGQKDQNPPPGSSPKVKVPGVDPSTVAVLPIASDKLYLRVHNNCTTQSATGPFFIDFYNACSSSGASTWKGPQFQVDCNDSWDNLCLRTYYARVEVCKDGFLEPNCRNYGSTWKPTGLIQNNADRMRFGVFGYLLDMDRARAGGVMRAKIKDVGPMTIDPVNPPVANPRAEFSDNNGTLVANPDNADATASGVSQSGVINYLNKFGKASERYKSADTISEMYYESLRYLKNMGSATPQYVTPAPTAAMKDGFPVITTWDDPVKYVCQKNYALMIADVNAHCDYALPGSSLGDFNNHCLSSTSHPTTVSNAPSGLNVATSTKKVGDLDNSAGWNTTGYANLSTVYASILNPSGSTNSRANTWYLAGLAYWANTTNLRPDLTGASSSDRVTVQTYTVDVAESGSWFVNNAANQPINQLWLAAKYGGFNDINFNGVPANQQTWDKDGNGTPDNYFLASRPDKIGASLSSVFNDVLTKTESAAGATLISSQVQNGDSIYEVQYTSTGWVGDVFASTITFDALGNPSTAPAWSARPLLDSLVLSGGWSTARKIATWNGTTGVPFRIASPGITAAQQSALGPTAAVQQEVLNFLRGDRSKEGAPYRIRNGILGDIVSAEAVAVAAPQAVYSEATNPGYTGPTGFKASKAGRQKMVYAASNDGMLHAFAGATPGGGQELFAYVPSFGFNGPSTPATPTIDGLAALAQSGYQHRYYIDSTPVVADVDFARTGGNPSLVLPTTFDWRTILVGGLGKGGKGYYALDITDPAGMATSETALAAKVLWEFTDPDMGFTYGKPVITKLRQYGWVVMVASGYNNPNPGKGWLYILNAKTGQLLQKITTNFGSTGNPSGFAHIAGYSISFEDYTVEQVYGGDLFGNVWRFDVSSPTASPYPAPVTIAELKDSLNNPQPVTTAPRVEVALNGITRWVFIGTGKLLDNTDMGNTQTQTMYAFRDGSKSEPATAFLLPPGITHPLKRADFVSLSDADLLTGVTVPPDKIGWLHDLSGVGTGGGTERVAFDLVANSGIVAWFGNIPSADPCSPGVTSRTYAVAYETGKTALLDSVGGTMAVPFYQATFGIVKLQFIKVNDRVELLSSDRTRNVWQVPGQFSGAVQPPRRINWREIIN
ncbi:MAG TPA: PilC/PilY family type IV pilus protein [Gemmatimonadales bacterium]